MIFLRAIPFSFSILWRYMIALPVLIMMLVVFGFIATFLALISALMSPFVSVLIIVAFSVGASVIPVMVGLRVGLQSYLIKPRVNYIQLMKPAIGYGIFEAILMFIILAIAAGLFVLLSSMAPQDLMAVDLSDEEAAAADLIAISPVLAWALIGFVAFAALAIRAALLVPLAGASVGADPSGRPHTPFFGFGSHFGSVFALVVLSQIGLFFVVPIALWVFQSLEMAQAAVMQITLVASALDEFSDLANLRLEAFALIGFVVFLFLFFFSLQCAGAALVYVDEYKLVGKRQEEFDEAMRVEEERARPMQDTDLRELMRSRMPERKY